MTSPALGKRPAVIGAIVALLAALVIVGLALAPTDVQEANLRAPAQTSVAVLRPGQQVCVSPGLVGAPTEAIAVWGGPVLSSARVAVTASGLSGTPLLTSGRFTARSAGEYVVKLSAPIPASRHFRACIRAIFNAFSVLGTPPSPSLALLHRVSGLAALDLAFSRAALWHPSWVGSWTFWVLAAGLLASFAVAVLAVACASREDEEQTQ